MTRDFGALVPSSSLQPPTFPSKTASATSPGLRETYTRSQRDGTACPTGRLICRRCMWRSSSSLGKVSESVQRGTETSTDSARVCVCSGAHTHGALGNTRVHTKKCEHACTLSFIHTYSHVSIYTHAYTLLYMCPHTYTCVYTNVYKYTLSQNMVFFF